MWTRGIIVQDEWDEGRKFSVPECQGRFEHAGEAAEAVLARVAPMAVVLGERVLVIGGQYVVFLDVDGDVQEIGEVEEPPVKPWRDAPPKASREALPPGWEWGDDIPF